MKIEFGRTSWKALEEIRDAIRSNRKGGLELAEALRLLRIGLADAIDAEIQRLKLTGERPSGLAIMSIELEVSDDPRVDYGPRKKRNLLQELDEVLNQPKN